ncbi:hypothetical protein [Streptomyces luteireticuli]|uniref:Uncharacterized protein n=1 Tax=Streptomyces luteireticuli TaxID=173858 RepID=A0ABN0YX80_9ACTN
METQVLELQELPQSDEQLGDPSMHCGTGLADSDFTCQHCTTYHTRFC